MRRSACLSVALAILLSLTVVSAGAAGAAPDQGGAYVPAARGEDPGNSGSPDKADKKNQKEELCPQEKWVIALPIEGLACILLLPKPPGSDQGQQDGGGGGLGSLFG
ncbi:MAG: hypothetical protein ACRD0C_23555 [Acidimicrobiia bacterium]